MTRAASRSAADLPADGDESLTARAYRIIERSLIVGGLRPGDVLSEPALMAATGCGRTPVREAIQRLARAHLLTIVPYHGAFVAPVDPRTQMKVLEMRRELDPVVAAAACRRVGAAARRRLHGLAARLRRGLADGDNLVVVEVDGEFKRLLLRLCGNPHLARTMEPVYAVARRFYFSTVIEPDLEVGHRHIAHIERVAGGDPAAAAAAASDFVAAIDALTRAAMMTSALR